MTTIADQPPKSAPIVLIVIGTISFIATLYAVTLFVCAVWTIAPPDDIISNFKDVGLVALGALGSLLARTGHEATKTEITNTSANPVPTENQEHIEKPL